MNKEKYLNILRKELKNNRVEDIDEIIAEYEEHFLHKSSDGYSEEETAAKLGAPEMIATQFVTEADQATGANVLTKIGVVILDMILFLVDLMLYAFVAVLGAVAIGLFACGLYLFFSGELSMISIPYIPFIGRLMLGISALSLSVLTGIGTVYYAMFVTQLNRAYFRWHKNVMAGRHTLSYSVVPRTSPKQRRRLRTVAFASLLLCAVSFVAGCVSMAVSAGSLEFWHAWHWFL